MPISRQRQSLLAGALVLMVALSVSPGAASTPATSPEFRTYWYAQGAEISRYTLAQSRYGEVHNGHAVLVFVTEGFNAVRQVKADRPGAPGVVPALKLNMTRKFLTGIYPYSIMTSIFTPLQGDLLPPKISFTSQEWCGHVFAQFNREADHYRVQQRSYFETEGDRDFKLPALFSEDGLWTQIRLRPDQLPTGTVDIIPSALYARLTHTAIAPQTATAQITKAGKRGLEGQPLMVYSLRFDHSERLLKIHFGAQFPHRIEGWEDTYTVSAHFGGRQLTTTARRTHTLMIDYWNRHQNGDRHWRTKLGMADH